ncbi:MAG: hypothetical protein PWP66_359 [Thermosediminibacterales bacterium]|nr:hypothetical protein [Thermosediminibacterales bacterium]
MECFHCNNCKQGQDIYYCLAKDEFIINENMAPKEKNRGGWKKGDPSYELRRRKIRKERDDLKSII